MMHPGPLDLAAEETVVGKSLSHHLYIGRILPSS